MTTVSIDNDNADGLPRWDPVQGKEVARISQKLPPNSRATIVSEASAILSRCVDPSGEPRRDVGLVVGYVQSGKTLSFTSLCALARDNQYPLIIVITGTATSLMRQSDKRLVRDLVADREDRQWQHVPFDTHSPSLVQVLESALQEWRDADMPATLRRTTLITVLKNYANLRKLRRELQSSALRTMLAELPILIIDDEADQASLNSGVRKNTLSSTYARIQELRAVLPFHSYVQYTATPQAPVLINIIDALSPSWVEVLTPGDNYTGGETFFGEETRRSHVRTIPPSEVYDPNTNALPSPPRTFKLALASFFIGVANAYAREQLTGNRSMLVHPHQNVSRHDVYFAWARALKETWLVLCSPAGEAEPDRTLMEEIFVAAYADLEVTAGENLLPLSQLLGRPMLLAIRGTNVQVVNANGGKTPDVPFENIYAHVLVGGQSMDRGFTVEGLTVTYMPRGMGVGNADTIQQRARFFGYKKAYLGLCRVWLEQATLDAMVAYVHHEQSIRAELIRHRDTNTSLKEWKRRFFLSPLLDPTRKEVLTLRATGDFYSSGGTARASRLPVDWIFPDCPHLSTDPPDFNEKLIDELVAELSWRPDAGDERRTPMQRHMVANDGSIERIIRFISDLRYVDVQDSEQNTGMLLQLQAWIARGDGPTEVLVYQMGSGLVRERTLSAEDEIGPLLQGENASSGYQGDRRLFAEHAITVQLHRICIKPNAAAGNSSIENDVVMRVVAVGVPANARRAWIAQDPE